MGGKRARRDASTADWRGGFDYVVAWLDRMAEGAAKRALVFEAELKNGEYCGPSDGRRARLFSPRTVSRRSIRCAL